MDRNNDDQKTGQWVDDQMASLNADANWSPNSSRAFERVMGVQGQATNSGGRMWMAVAVSAAIGLVLFSLPWRQLRSVIKPSTSQSTAQAQTSEPIQAQPAQVQNVAPPQQTEPRVAEPSSTSTKSFAKPLVEPSGAATSHAREYILIPSVQKFQGFASQGQAQAAAQAQDEPKPKKSTGSAIPPRVIKTVDPVYTDEARIAHIQGTVTLAVAIHKDGTAMVTNVVRGLGYGLDEAAIRAVEQFQFEPGTMNGQAVEASARLDVNFHLF